MQRVIESTKTFTLSIYGTGGPSICFFRSLGFFREERKRFDFS